MNEDLVKRVNETLDAEKKSAEANKLKTKIQALNMLGVTYTINVTDPGEYEDLVQEIMDL